MTLLLSATVTKITAHKQEDEGSLAEMLMLTGTPAIPTEVFPGLASGYRPEYPGLIAAALIDEYFWSRSRCRSRREDPINRSFTTQKSEKPATQSI